MKKILALTLSLALVVLVFAFCVTAQATKTEGEYYYTPADSVGYHEDGLIIQDGDSTTLTGEALSAVAPRIATGGVDGSNAMEVGGDMIFNRYLVPFRITGLALDTTYVIQMDVKRTSGNVRKIQAGVWRSGTYNYSETEYTNDSISSDAFTTLTFEHSLSGSYIPYYLVFTFNTTSAGGTMLVDNIVVYEKDDENKINLFNTKLNVDTGTEAPGTFDKSKELWFDNTVEDGLVYTPIELTTSSYRDATNLTPEIISGGIKGSNALKLTGVASKQSTLYFQPSGTNLYSTDTQYTIEMKIKKTAGSVNTNGLMLGINEGGTLNWTQTLSDDVLTDEWVYYKWSHTVAKGGWQYLALRFTSGSEAATIIVDDIKIYLASDTTKTPLKFEADLDADCDFDAKVEYKLTDTCGEYAIINNVIFIPQLNTQAQALKTACNAPESVTVSILDGDAALADTDALKTDAVLSATVEGNTTTYAIAVKNDVNSNGEFNITDLVKADEIMNGAEATLAQIVAAGANDGAISTTQIGAIITALLAKN